MRIDWATVGKIVKRVYDDIKAQGTDLFEGLTSIGIDETSYRKGHKYMTVVVNHNTGALVWAAKGHGKEVLRDFFETIGKERCAKIHFVTADGARWISDCVSAYCENAKRCIDPFHVVQWTTNALDEVRRSVWKQTRQEVAAIRKVRKPGRPKSSDKPPRNKAEEVKGARYALLKNPENLTQSQEVIIEMLAKENPMLYRAYLIKERLRLIFKLPLPEAATELNAWIKWAQHCRIPQFVELQQKIKRHRAAILASIDYGLSNARIEAVNNKIKLTIRMGYGFRNMENMTAMVMLRCSKLNVILPGRA